MLNAELTEHLGYEKNEYMDNNENYRNGYSQKTVHSSEGDITLNVPSKTRWNSSKKSSIYSIRG